MEEAPRADPMAQTAIGSGIQDQINLEGVGSGSGLLDLTRESDDTSLGAELLDEISPGGSTGVGARRGTVSAGDSAIAEAAAPSRGRSAITPPVYVEAPDPAAPAMGALALAGALFVVFAIFALANALVGARPDFIKNLYGNMTTFLAVAAGVCILFLGAGFMFGKMGRR
jgi:hypothetical protein